MGSTGRNIGLNNNNGRPSIRVLGAAGGGQSSIVFGDEDQENRSRPRARPQNRSNGSFNTMNACMGMTTTVDEKKKEIADNKEKKENAAAAAAATAAGNQKPADPSRNYAGGDNSA